ncbi:TMV resistance protein N [Spatholobus suberectus]|nr:TMV resistance protein N [Spatholobus suberectus]
MAVKSSSYDAFLSFRGSDTRHGFTGHLYKALCDSGIYTFIDDEELQRGEEITPALVKAIEGSRIAIIVLSKDYASSSFCLDELATILDYKSKGLLVIPVFYKVNPSDVRHQKGSYEKALAKHQERLKHNMDKLQKWKMALRQVADLSGYHLQDGDEYEYKFIVSVVDLVSDKINPARLHVGDYLVGLESRVTEVMKLLDVGSDDDGVHMIGIHGMGGVGKSTLARAAYNNLIAQNFDGLCYLEKVREESHKHGLKHLQSVLLQEILKKEIKVASVDKGALMIPQRLHGKKVLLVLDDVDEHEQLQAIVGSPDWFGPGSRVIITTRDKQLLTSHEVERTYEVNELNENDALQLLTWKAFKEEKADPTYAEVLKRVVTYASGLPLALEVIGSNLFRKSIKEWESAINQYKRIPHNRIQDILKVSFDALQDEEKSVFLDIACCLKGYKLTEVEVILGALYDDSMEHHIGVLVEKSLIKVDQCGTVELHDLIQDMGRQIDQMESPKNPGKRRRLWLPKDIIQVLEDNTGTREIEIIYLDVPISDEEETIEWDGNAFKEMKRLKILIIKSGKFSEGPKCLPNSLRVLEWWGYPSHCLPSDFQPRKLVICKLPNGFITSFELLDDLSKASLTSTLFSTCKLINSLHSILISFLFPLCFFAEESNSFEFWWMQKFKTDT